MPYREQNNYTPFAHLVGLNPDYEPEEGWELLFKLTGSPTDPIPANQNPYWAFYNKYSAKLRFFLLKQETTLLGGGVNNVGGNLELFFVPANVPTAPSNLLTASHNPMLPIDQYRDYRNATHKFAAPHNI